MSSSRLAALALSSLTLMAQATPPPPIIVPEPIGPQHVRTPNDRRLFAWLPGEVRCGGTAVAARVMRRPYLALAYDGPQTRAPIDYRFRLTADGRPLSIERDGPAYVPYADDVGPSLATSRFAPSGERRDCRVTYTPRLTAFADTPLPDLISYTVNPTNGQLPREGWAAIFPATATCDKEPRPAPLTQTFPDFDKVAGTQGVRDWTMLAYDLDAKGQPVGVKVLTGTANRSLDAAAVQAIGRSRYTEGPKTGCRFPYRKAPTIMPAPDAPDQATFRAAAATCPKEIDWASRPPLRYPDPYRKHSIEGWAIIGFDVAPWGATGAVKVLASEPSAEFGQAAVQLIREGVMKVSDAGYTGCVERVRFLMGRPGLAPNTEVAG